MRLGSCLPRSPDSLGAETLVCHMFFQGTCHLSDLDAGVVIDVERGHWRQCFCLSTTQPPALLDTGLLLLAGIRTLVSGLDTCSCAPYAIATSFVVSSFGPSIAFCVGGGLLAAGLGLGLRLNAIPYLAVEIVGVRCTNLAF